MRKRFVKALVGSHVTGTNHEGSDKDYIEILVPTLGDIVSQTKVNLGKSGADDLVQKDIRDYIKLLSQGNPVFLNTLFTHSYEADDEMKPFFLELLSMREQIAASNIKDLYGASLGMATQRMRLANESTEATKLSEEDRYKVCKNYANVVQIAETFIAYHHDNFTSYSDALALNRLLRDTIMDIKLSKISPHLSKAIALKSLTKLESLRADVVAEGGSMNRFGVFNRMTDIAKRAIKRSIELE